MVPSIFRKPKSPVNFSFERPAIIPGIRPKNAHEKYVMDCVWDSFAVAFCMGYENDDVHEASACLKQALQRNMAEFPHMLNIVKSIAIYFHRHIFIPTTTHTENEKIQEDNVLS